MPQQHTFEGPRLTDVLAEMQQTLGDAAVVVSATRTRRGGIAGFFAREHFVVTAEVPDAEMPAAPMDAPDALLRLADEVSAREQATLRSGDPFAAALRAALREEPIRAEPIVAERVPETPRRIRRGGTVHVVGGTGALSLERARALAVKVGAGDVVVAQPDRPLGGVPSWLWIASAGDAARRRDRWAARTEPVVVALDTTDIDWADAILDALQPCELSLTGAGAERRAVGAGRG